MNVSDVKLRLILAEYGHDVQTVSFAGYKGLKNGKLLTAAEGNFDVFMTIDKTLGIRQISGSAGFLS